MAWCHHVTRRVWLPIVGSDWRELPEHAGFACAANASHLSHGVRATVTAAPTEEGRSDRSWDVLNLCVGSRTAAPVLGAIRTTRCVRLAGSRAAGGIRWARLPERSSNPGRRATCERHSGPASASGLVPELRRLCRGRGAKAGLPLLREQPERRGDLALRGLAHRTHDRRVEPEAVLSPLLHTARLRPGLHLADAELALSPAARPW